MKKVLLLAFLALTVNGFSQTDFRFADSTALWFVLYTSTGGTTPPGTQHTSDYYVQKDTVISGKNYQKIDNRFTRKDSSGAVYQISDLDTSEYLVYDFSKQAGDSIPNVGFSCCEILCVVDSVDSVFIGHARKRMFVRYPEMFFLSDIWVDGIGSLQQYFLFPQSTMPRIMEEPMIELLCFFEQGQHLYTHPDYDTCIVELSVGVGEIHNLQSAIRISPNPATLHLAIQLKQTPSSTTTFRLFDLTGRLILQQPLTEKETQIELSGVSKGMYLYEVTFAGQKAGSGKLIIE